MRVSAHKKRAAVDAETRPVHTSQRYSIDGGVVHVSVEFMVDRAEIESVSGDELRQALIDALYTYEDSAGVLFGPLSFAFVVGARA